MRSGARPISKTLPSADTLQPVEGTPVCLTPGPLGFEGYHDFVLIEEPESPVIWMRSVDEPLLAFPTIEPFLIYPEYSFELSDTEAEALRLRTPADALVLVILTLRSEPPGITANLMAPVVVNRKEGLARQIVLADSGYHLRYPLTHVTRRAATRRPARKRRAPA